MHRILLSLGFLLTISISITAQYPDRFIHYRSIPTSNAAWQQALESYANEDLPKAIEITIKAEQEFRNRKDWESFLFINNFKAQLLGEIGKPKDALESLLSARTNTKNLVDTLLSIEYIENLSLTGRVYTLVNDYKSSIVFFNRAISVLEQKGKYPEVLALVNYTLWEIHSKLMSAQLAKIHIEKAVDCLTGIDSEYSRAILYFIQADRLDISQLYLKAELFTESVKAFERCNSTRDYLYFTGLMKLTQQYSSFQSDYSKAIEYGKQAEKYATENRLSRAREYRLHIALGDMYRSFKKYNMAIPHFEKAYSITKEVFGNNSMEYLLTNLHLGRLYRYMNSYERSTRYFYEAYRAGKQGWKDRFPNEFTLYGELGRLYSSIGKPDSALFYAQKRLAYEHKVDTFSVNQIPPSPKASNTVRYYNSLAIKIEAYKQLYQQTKDTSILSIALDHCNYTFNLLNKINELSMGEKSGLRNSSRTKLISSYAIYFGLELSKLRNDNRFVKEALLYCERSKANYLKYLLETRYQGIQVSLTDEKSIKRRIDSLENISIQLKTSSNKNISDSLSKEIITLKLELANAVLKTKNQSKSTNSEQFLNPSIPEINIDLLQKSIPEKVAILIYHIDRFEDEEEEYVGEGSKSNKRLVVFYIDNKVIEVSSRVFNQENSESVTKFKRSIKTGNNNDYIEFGSKLHTLLLKPFGSKLASIQKVVIIPDTQFADIPLESLPINNSGITLCNTHSTSYHYSLGLWEKSNSKSKVKHTQSIAAFAPNFSGNTGAISFAQLSTTNADSLFAYNADILRDGEKLAELPLAKEEVIEIGKLFSKNRSSNIKVAYDLVTKQDFISNSDKYDIIHIASHGFADINDFRNSGIFFSSNPIDYDNKNNFLHLNEIYSLNLQANLVVLSACKTSVGERIRGEGIIALPRGFLYAGVPNVIASLWKVHDEKTKILMVAFYKHLLKGNSYSESLRLAKLDCIKKGFLPIDWAGFILIGS